MPAYRYDYQLEVPRGLLAGAASFESEQPMQADIYEFLAPFVPTVGSIAKIAGSWSSSIAKPFQAERISEDAIAVSVHRQGYRRASATFHVHEGSLEMMGAVHLVV